MICWWNSGHRHPTMDISEQAAQSEVHSEHPLPSTKLAKKPKLLADFPPVIQHSVVPQGYGVLRHQHADCCFFRSFQRRMGPIRKLTGWGWLGIFRASRDGGVSPNGYPLHPTMTKPPSDLVSINLRVVSTASHCVHQAMLKQFDPSN